MTDYRQPPQPSQPQPQPAAPQPEGPRGSHVHHSYIWLGSLRTAFMLLAIVVFSSFSAIIGAISEGEAITRGDIPMLFIVIGSVIAGIVVLVALVAVYQVISYKHLYYELGPEEFNLYSGILNKKRVHVPYQRIQSVDQHATLIQRIFGVCSVSIDTAGGAANKAVIVPYVQKTQAEELRRELFARKQYAVAVRNGAAPDAALRRWPLQRAFPRKPCTRAPMCWTLPPRSGRTCAACSAAPRWIRARDLRVRHVQQGARVHRPVDIRRSSSWLSASSAPFPSSWVRWRPSSPGSMEPLVGNVVATSVRLFGGSLIAAGVATFLAASLVLWLLSAIGACVSYGGFRACRRDNRIEVEHGLLQHRFQGVDVDRVQSVMVKQSFIRRLLGYCELSLGKIDAAAENSDDQQKGLSQQGLVIHPFVKMSRVPEILAGIVPEFADVPTENIPVAPVGLRRALIRRCIIQGTGFWLAVLVAAGQIAVNLLADPAVPDGAMTLFFVNNGALFGYALAVVLLVLDAVGAVLWFRGSGFAYNERFMQVSNGGFARETISFPRKKIQFGYTKTNPFQRNAGTATVNARTAAGVGGTTIRLIDAREDDARAWLAWLKPHGNVIQ